MIAASDVERFWSKVDKNGPIPEHCPELGPCWVWKAGRDKDGYGKIWFLSKHQRAHRVSFFLAHGRWPEPQGCHHCDNPSCCNDSHLFEGTNTANTADRHSKGRSASGDRNASRLYPHRRPRGDGHYSRMRPERMARGERHGSAKLTEQTVRDIRANYLLCRVTQQELADRFGVSRSVVGDIVRGEAWTHAL